MAGIAVDAMRAEHERVRLQGATDRAALAATTRRVTLAPWATMPAGLMRLIGGDTLPVSARSPAIDSIGPTRIENLRDAASDLVTRLLRDRAPGEMALTIVPNAEHVLPPPNFADHFVNLPPGPSSCCGAAWRTALSSRCCGAAAPTQGWRSVRPYLRNAAEAVAVVQGLQASGTTAIALGVR